MEARCHSPPSRIRSCENIPWLTLPYLDSCCKRLGRIFSCYDEQERYYNGEGGGDRLVIINLREPNIDKRFYDRHGADIIHHFGIEAYPFTRQRVVELECARRKEEVKLQLIFAAGGPPLLRHRGGGAYDRVPVSQLWGKHVLLLFAPRSAYKSSKFIANLESRYLEQNVFEVVYISCEADFENCTAEMPWLLYTQSWDFVHTWRSKIFTINERDDESSNESDDESDSDSDGDGESCYIDKGAIVAFDVDGEFMSTNDRLDDLAVRREYPFFNPDKMRDYVFKDVTRKYRLSGDFYG